MRHIGAVLAGLVAILVLSIGTDMALRAAGVFPGMGERMGNALLLLATAYRGVYSIAGSYIAARLAPDRPMAHALALGAVGVAVSLTGAVVTWHAGAEYDPKWYPLALIVIAMPCAWVGGKLRG